LKRALTAALVASTAVGWGCADHVSEVVRATASSREDTPASGCTAFSPASPWNTDISAAAVDPLSDRYIASIGLDAPLVANFGTDRSTGIPYVVVPSDQPLVPIAFVKDTESDPGPYPIPDDMVIEANADAHALIIEKDTCLLYEIYQLANDATGWHGYSGALFKLREDTRRPLYATSADGAGLPIYPGLVRYTEVASGVIPHALRISVTQTQHGFVEPATHYASLDTNPDLPPMGLRLRLKANVDISALTGAAHVIAIALQRYGVFIADNRGPFVVSGTSDARFSTQELSLLQSLKAGDFEATLAGPITTQ
jgi:hypothetical protein